MAATIWFNPMSKQTQTVAPFSGWLPGPRAARTEPPTPSACNWPISQSREGNRPVRVTNSTPFSLPSLMRSEEHTSELQSLMRISYAVFCLKKKQHYSKHKRPYYTQEH